MHPSQQSRRGISLLEVLISIGILSVGLASVLALLPAGGSQAKKAMVEDRRSALGSAAIGDFINRGFLNPSKWSIATLPPIVIDPLGSNTTLTNGDPRFPSGIVEVSVAAPTDDVFVGSDDLSVQIPDDESGAPTFRLSNGNRLSEGKFCWLATLVPIESGAVTSTDSFRLSIVEFYQRSFDTAAGESARVFDAAFTGQSASIAPPSFSKDDFKKFFPKGSIVLATNGSRFRWLRILMAAPTEAADGSVSDIDLELDQDVTAGAFAFTPNKIYAYAGSVGVAEQIVRLEEETPWTAP